MSLSYSEQAKALFDPPSGLYSSTPHTVDDLAEKLGCAPATARRIIKKLEAEGYLETFEEARMGPGGYPQAWAKA